MPGVGQPVNTLQGVAAQNVAIAPAEFYPATRRMRYAMKSAGPFAGFGSVDSTTLKQTGIIAGLVVRISGKLTFGGTITGTTMLWRWPYDLVKAAKVSANGQANLINCKGSFLKALQMTQQHVQDSGVSRKIGANMVQTGTLSLPSDNWGTDGSGNQLGPNVTVPATGDYNVDLTFYVPIAFDPKTLLGAVFAQTAQTNLTADIEYELQNNLVSLGASATLIANLTSEIEGVVYTIPQVAGQFVVPDLSAFHQVVSSRITALAQGDNEIMLPGTGIGRQLMRVLFQVWSGAGANAAPLPVTDANYGQVGWRYGGNDTPEVYRNGSLLRAANIDTLGVDLGGQWGIGVHDFCADWALRDSVDEGSTSDLRLLANLVNAPTAPGFEFCQQTVFAAPVGA